MVNWRFPSDILYQHLMEQAKFFANTILYETLRNGPIVNFLLFFDAIFLMSLL
jgi:hypothetical protein